MTDDEARLILNGNEAWIDWDEDRQQPLWSEATIGLNGYFTADQLLAILHFASPRAAMAHGPDFRAIQARPADPE